MSTRGRHAKPGRRTPRILAVLMLLLLAGGATGGIVARQHFGQTATQSPEATESASPSAIPSVPTPIPTLVVAPDPAPVPALVGANLPGEGRWTTVVRNGADPAVETTWLRLGTDPGNVAHIAWLSRRQLRFELRPGTSQPGIAPGVTAAPWITPEQRSGLAVTFNGGFRMVDSFGGFMVDQQVLWPLLKRSASAVIYRDGRLDVGAWGTDVHLTPRVRSVRQELYPLLDNGVPGPNLTTNVVLQWGGIVGPSIHTWRSALGVTDAGDVIYLMGAQLAPDDMVRLLAQVGVVRAMELDINPNWVTFSWFGANGVAHRLAPFSQSAARYLSGPSSRDFFAAYLR